jgi:hypothetical protein
VVAARRGGHPAPPSPELGLAYLIAGLIRDWLKMVLEAVPKEAEGSRMEKAEFDCQNQLL